MRYDIFKTQLLTTFVHVITFTFFFFLKKKKPLKLGRGLPYHIGKMVKSCVLKWQKIISLKIYVVLTYAKGYIMLLETELKEFFYNPVCMRFLSVGKGILA
jgi:hypothetical protein